LITTQAIRRGSFDSVSDLKRQITPFVDHYNQHPKPFMWTATAESILAKLERLCKVIKSRQNTVTSTSKSEWLRCSTDTNGYLRKACRYPSACGDAFRICWRDIGFGDFTVAFDNLFLDPYRVAQPDAALSQPR
jgi:hypothetical protein